MINKIKELENELDDLKTALIIELKDSPEVKKRVKQYGEQLNEFNLGYDTYGEVCLFRAVNRFDFGPLSGYYLEALKEVLNDNYCAYCDSETLDSIIFIESQYDAIIVALNGNVYQEGKQILSKNDYKSTSELKLLIERHMDKTGCYSLVVRERDNYGFLSIIAV